MAKGKLRKKKLWHKSRFYHDMTNFYSAAERQRMWTKPTVELRKGFSKVESMTLSSPGGGSFRDESPQRSPKRGGGRLGRSPTKEQHSLASTDFALPKIEEDHAESNNLGGIATYSAKRKTSVKQPVQEEEKQPRAKVH